MEFAQIIELFSNATILSGFVLILVAVKIAYDRLQSTE